MQVVYEKSKLNLGPHPLCSGCMYGIILKLVLDTVDELGIDPLKVIFMCPPGCGCQLDRCVNFSSGVPGLGRSAATGTGLKRADPTNFIICFDGDGSDAAIGIGDVIHAAARGEKITILMINNSLFANTGGQMAPTTLMVQKTTTSPAGRRAEVEGYPVNLAEMVGAAAGCKFAARVAIYDPAHVIAAKKALKKAFQCQMELRGLSFVEFLSNCPTNWHMTPFETIEHIKNVSEKQYPLGIFADRE